MKKLKTNAICEMLGWAKETEVLCSLPSGFYFTKIGYIEDLILSAGKIMTGVYGAKVLSSVFAAVYSGCTGAAIWTKTISLLGGGASILLCVGGLLAIGYGAKWVAKKIVGYLYASDIKEFEASIETLKFAIVDIRGACEHILVHGWSEEAQKILHSAARKAKSALDIDNRLLAEHFKMQKLKFSELVELPFRLAAMPLNHT